MDRHRKRFGRLAPVTFRIDGRRASEESWRRGAEGEARTARRLEKLLRGSGVIVMHDLAVPGSRANIDHICVGPGGVTVIDSKNYTGRVAVGRGELWIDGRRRQKLVDGVVHQVELVRAALADAGIPAADVRGALAMCNVTGLPLFGRFEVDGVLIDGTRRVAKLARRRGELHDVDRVVVELRARFGRLGA